ncbi:MAG: hypothetical protein ACJARL_001856 [Halopseudomonas sp.]|jgi:hypothetical protein|uniref:hypothetical protein n=1 Tax=Halopseudomonas laoshanensis TaxID=2268758 RepID=UPI0037356AAA
MPHALTSYLLFFISDLKITQEKSGKTGKFSPAVLPPLSATQHTWVKITAD